MLKMEILPSCFGYLICNVLEIYETFITNFMLLQALRVPEPPVQSTVTGLIKCSQTNISGNTEHLTKWRPPCTTVIWYSGTICIFLGVGENFTSRSTHSKLLLTIYWWLGRVTYGWIGVSLEYLRFLTIVFGTYFCRNVTMNVKMNIRKLGKTQNCILGGGDVGSHLSLVIILSAILDDSHY